jgi:hypothetical protein
MFVGVHESGSATNESFVYFDFAIRPTELEKRTILHCQADAVKHEPSRLLSDAEGTAYFIGTDTVLAISDKPDSDKPLAQWQRGIFEDSSYFDGELFASVLGFAFPHPASGNESHIIAATSGTFNAIRPAPRNHEFVAVVWVGKVNDGLLESLWFGAHGVPHWQKYPINALLSQVYYCPYKSVSKQSTSTTFRMNTYEKVGRG